MVNLKLRNGSQSDQKWLYDLYCRTMRPCIETTWGWNEEFQVYGFSSNLAPSTFRIITIDEQDIGGFCLKEKDDHFYLDIILIDPIHQKKGVGKSAMNHMMGIAKNKNLPLKLSVIKKNIVKEFYEKLGFLQYDEDEEFYRMEWTS